MEWILVFISLVNGAPLSASYGHYNTMSDCFDAREILVEQTGRPVINYQVVCVASMHPDDLFEYQEERKYEIPRN